MTETSLGELSMDGGRYGIAASAVDYTPDLPAYLRITDIRDDGTLDLSSRKSVEDPNATDYMLEPNDIVFARTGNSTGRNYFYDPRDGRFAYAGFLIKFSLNPAEVNPRYIKYYAQSKPYWDWVASFNTGSTRGNINAKTYASMPITLPSRCTQDGIVRFCDAISDKIRVNGQINGYLEELARTLYHEIGNNHSHPAELAQIAQVNPETYSPKEAWETISYIDTSSLTNNECDSVQAIKPSEEKLPSRARRKVKRGDVLYSTVRPNQKHYGLLENVPHDALASTAFAVIRTESKWSPLVYLALTESSVTEALQQLAETSTSTIPSIRPSDLGEIEVALPSDAEGEYLDSQIRLCYRLFAANSLENNRLVELRDALLPKLMSGEIDVSKVEVPTQPNSHLCARRLKASRV